MKKARSLLALLLAAVTLLALPAAAFASNARYPEGQYYVEDTNATKGFGVQVSAANSYDGACRSRDKWLDMGFDAYVYYKDGKYRVICGKFLVKDDAKHYRETICSSSGKSDPYVVNVYLPDWLYEDFQKIYATDPLNSGSGGYVAWEKPTGPYYDGDGSASTKRVYTVQFSAGTNFTRIEQHRDEMIALGFDAFVYKHNGQYYAMSGMFERRSEAEQRCKAIIAYTPEDDAYVTTVDLPVGDVNYQPVQAQEDYYKLYAALLRDYAWAKQYLSRSDAELVSGNQPLDYVYYVCDIDANGVDELIIVDVVAIYNGVWAIFTYSGGRVCLVDSGGTFSIPAVSVCQEKGILAMQGYYKGVGACELLYIKNGSLTEMRNATVSSEDYVEVKPTDVDRYASGYYMMLKPYEITDTSRLTGGSGVKTASEGYTRAGVLAAARDAAERDSHYATVSDDGTELEVPGDSLFLKTPFKMKVKPSTSDKTAIYIMPRPEKDHGTLGTVKRDEIVTVLVETDYYYFFVTADGRAGWNGKSFFTKP